jgi:hypothetical protein
VVGEPGLHVDTEALTAHAASVEAAATAVRQAGAAAERVRLGFQAYGKLCQVVPASIDPVQRSAVSAARVSADALRSAADLLRQTASRYEVGEQSAVEALRRLEPEVKS